MHKDHYKVLKLLLGKKQIPDRLDSARHYCWTEGFIDGSDNVTEVGKCAMYEFQHRYMKWWIPVIISIAALVLSALIWLLPRRQVVELPVNGDTAYIVDIHHAPLEP